MKYQNLRRKKINKSDSTWSTPRPGAVEGLGHVQYGDKYPAAMHLPTGSATGRHTSAVDSVTKFCRLLYFYPR